MPKTTKRRRSRPLGGVQKLVDVGDDIDQVSALIQAAFIIAEESEQAVRDPLQAVILAIEEKLDAARVTLATALKQPKEMANG